MAIEVKFTGFVNEVKAFEWGTVLKVAHNQVKKTPDGKWETVAKDYMDVIVGSDAKFAEGDRIDVVGKLKTKLYDKKDGTKGISLEVRGDDVKKSQSSSTPSGSSVPDSWTQLPVDDSLPF
jgi:single-stranded DNA-binding protein